MTAPETAARRFAIACILGCALGLWYGFLRPLRPKRTTLADSLFILGAAYVWLVLGFGVCGSDLRLPVAAGLFAGGIGWEMTAGRLLRPVFRLFWRLLGRIGSFFWSPVKNFLKKVKILFASAKKWVTIKCNNRRNIRRASGVKNHGRNQDALAQFKDRSVPHQATDQGGGDRRYRIVYDGNDHPAPDPE